MKDKKTTKEVGPRTASRGIPEACCRQRPKTTRMANRPNQSVQAGGSASIAVSIERESQQIGMPQVPDRRCRSHPAETSDAEEFRIHAGIAYAKIVSDILPGASWSHR